MRCAAFSTMRRVLHEGHTPRPLQEKAIRRSCFALRAAGTGETVGENAALKIAAEVALDVTRR